MRNLAYLLLALTAGCAGIMKAPAEAPPVAAGPAKVPAAKAAPGAPVNQATHASAAPAAHASAAPATHASAAPATHASAAPAMAAQASAAPHLDLKGLEQRLKATSAIGVFTKLALKNQVDDLLTKFRTYHGGQQPPTLTDLRPNYELLIMKVQSLIQKDDPGLAADVARSREVIWGVLAEKSKFSLI